MATVVCREVAALEERICWDKKTGTDTTKKSKTLKSSLRMRYLMHNGAYLLYNIKWPSRNSTYEKAFKKEWPLNCKESLISADLTLYVQSPLCIIDQIIAENCNIKL